MLDSFNFMVIAAYTVVFFVKFGKKGQFIPDQSLGEGKLRIINKVSSWHLIPL